MNRYLLLCLLLTSLISCSPVSKFTKSHTEKSDFIKPVVHITSENQQVIYKAQIDIYKKHFSGLFVFKMVEADSAIRVVFMSEMGMSFFDFEYKNNAFTTKQVMPGFDRDIIVNTFQEDLKQILFDPLHGDNLQLYENDKQNNIFAQRTDFSNLKHYYFYETETLKSIISKGTVRKKKIVSIENADAVFPQKIVIKHKGVKLSIQLDKLQ